MLVRAAYAILIVVSIGWLWLVVKDLVAALPWGLLGLATLVAFGLIFIGVLRDRMESSDDDYYENHVDL